MSSPAATHTQTHSSQQTQMALCWCGLERPKFHKLQLMIFMRLEFRMSHSIHVPNHTRISSNFRRIWWYSVSAFSYVCVCVWLSTRRKTYWFINCFHRLLFVSVCAARKLVIGDYKIKARERAREFIRDNKNKWESSSSSSTVVILCERLWQSKFFLFCTFSQKSLARVIRFVHVPTSGSAYILNNKQQYTNTQFYFISGPPWAWMCNQKENTFFFRARVRRTLSWDYKNRKQKQSAMGAQVIMDAEV